jgi:tetratricopeptide (TPR) repeat protein
VKFIILLFPIFFALPQQDPFELNQFMLAESYEQSGNLQKAIEIVENLYQKNPNNHNYFNKLYNLYLLTKKYETAIRLVELKLSVNPEDISLYGLKGSVYYLMGNYDLAKKNWEIPIKKNPENPFTYRMMANYAIERRAFDIAIEFLSAGKNKSSDKSIFSMDLGELYLITMQYESAVKEYCELLTQNQNMYAVIESKIFSFINKPDILKNSIKIVEKYQNYDVVFLNLLAKLHTEIKEFDKAFEYYKKIENQQSNAGQQLVSFANFLVNEKEYESAKKVFEYLYNNSNNNSIKSTAKLGLAKVLEAILWNEFNQKNDIWKNYYSTKYFDKLKTNLVLEAYQSVIDLFKFSDVAVEAIFSIGRINFYVNNDLNSAEEFFSEIINKYPTSRFYSRSLLEVALIKIIQNDFQSAIDYLNRIESSTTFIEEDKLSSYFYLAKLYAVEGNFNKAGTYLRKITDDVRNDFTNDALEFSLLLNTAKNDSINLLKYSKAEILVIQKDYKQAKKIYEEILSNRQSFILQPFCLIKIAEMEVALNQYQLALLKLDEIYNQKEKNIFSDKALFLKGKIYEYELNDYEQAISSYKNLLLEFPKSIYSDEARESINRLNKENIRKEKDA